MEMISFLRAHPRPTCSAGQNRFDLSAPTHPLHASSEASAPRTEVASARICSGLPREQGARGPRRFALPGKQAPRLESQGGWPRMELPPPPPPRGFPREQAPRFPRSPSVWRPPQEQETEGGPRRSPPEPAWPSPLRTHSERVKGREAEAAGPDWRPCQAIAGQGAPGRSWRGRRATAVATARAEERRARASSMVVACGGDNSGGHRGKQRSGNLTWGSRSPEGTGKKGAWSGRASSACKARGGCAPRA